MYNVTKHLLDIFMEADISYHVFEEPFDDVQQFDLGLRGTLIPMEESPYDAFIQRIRRMKEKTLYQLKDVFSTQYLVCRLPDEPVARWLCVGPVLIVKPGGEDILSLLRQLGLPNSAYYELDGYYDRLPQLRLQEVFDRISMFIADSVFGGKDQYAVKVIHNSPEPDILQQIISHADPMTPEPVEEKMKRLQNRYDLQDAFLKKVKTGNFRESITAYYRYLKAFQNEQNFESGFYRMQDLLRDAKDIGITLNTLLRKAAQDAGVHPYFLSSFSNSCFLRIEQFHTYAELRTYYRDMIAGYCSLIQEHALNQYSQPIQAAIRLVQTELSEDLSVTAVAEKLNMNRNYLSDLFRRETGETFSAYVLRKRIEQAKHLLSSTPLPIQDIAWAVGIPDANYFARLFRRETGQTPKDFRSIKKRQP